MTYIVKRVLESGYGDWTYSEDVPRHGDVERFAVYTPSVPKCGADWYAVFSNKEDADLFASFKELTT